MPTSWARHSPGFWMVCWNPCCTHPSAARVSYWSSCQNNKNKAHEEDEIKTQTCAHLSEKSLSRLTAWAPRRSSRSTEESWGPAAGPPPGFCSAPESGGLSYSAGTALRGPPCRHLFSRLHFHWSPALGCLHLGTTKRSLKKTPPWQQSGKIRSADVLIKRKKNTWN